MRNLQEHERRLREAFCSDLALRGFSATMSEVTFTREKQEVEQSITFSSRWEYGAECFRFHFYVADRYRGLERFLGGDQSDELLPFIASPIHLLRADKSLYEWCLDDPTTVISVLEQIDTFGIPFLDKYVDLRVVRMRWSQMNTRLRR